MKLASTLVRLSALSAALASPLQLAARENTIGGFPDLLDATFDQLQDGLTEGRFTSVDLTKAYLARIDDVDFLRAVIKTSPVALQAAREADEARKNGRAKGPLFGLPFLIKDNIDTQHEDGMNTTAGSYALVNTVVPGDAEVIKRLKAAGAIVLGKANLSQWAFWRADDGIPSGWSSVGGQCTGIYYPSLNPSGSSGGSGVAVSAGLAAAALGSDTGGSVIYPASSSNTVGIRPTIGLVSRTGVVPITSNHDTVGPMARTVKEAAQLLQVLAGTDESDSFTLNQPMEVPDYVKGLKKDALSGVRIGVPRKHYANYTANGLAPAISPVFEQALTVFKDLGAHIIDPADFEDVDRFLNSTNVFKVWDVDFKVQVAEYISTLKEVPSGVTDLGSLIDFNNNNRELEQPSSYEGQSIWDRSNLTTGYNSTYIGWVNENSVIGKGSIDVVLKKYDVEALIFPSPQSRVACSLCDTRTALAGQKLASFGWAKAGYPQVTVPPGALPADTEPVQVQDHPGNQTYDPAPNLPFGLTFAGSGFTEAKLLSYAYAFEQATFRRLQVKPYKEAIPKTQLADIVGKSQS